MAETKVKTGRRAVNFEIRELPGKEIFIAGEFNDWKLVKKLEDKNGDGIYRCRLMLFPGTYQYKFYVDGQWRSDAANPDFVPNEFGSLNSVLQIDAK
jgi:1,4-alpha-glucan branching enzyme